MEAVVRTSPIILSAGAIKTHDLPMLSGVGPADSLRQHGITVVHESPGVGQSTRDHPSLAVNFQVKEDRDAVTR